MQAPIFRIHTHGRAARFSPTHHSRSTIVTVRAAASQDHTFFKRNSAAGDVQIEVQPTESAVSKYITKAIETAAADAIEKRGVFTLAIPGGSVLKSLCALKQSSSLDFSKIRLFFVNHKCIPLDDPNSTYFKARKVFIDEMMPNDGNNNIAVPLWDGTSTPTEVAADYERQLMNMADELSMARCKSGAPRFDLMLLGMGADGHIGSLYPLRPEVLVTRKTAETANKKGGEGGEQYISDSSSDTGSGWLVLPVEKSNPPASITFSLPVMNAARRVILAVTGGSKSGAVKKALEEKVKPGEFPAQMLVPDGYRAIWLLDEAAASDLTLLKD